MRRTYVRRSSEAIAATPQLVSFCDAINVEFVGRGDVFEFHPSTNIKGMLRYNRREVNFGRKSLI